jgi:hypothetical protein
MLLLSAPFDVAAAAPPRPMARAVFQVGAVVGLLVAACLFIDWFSPGLGGLGHAMAGATIHGGLIGLGWLIVTGASARWVGPISRIGGALLVASVAARLGPWGSLAFVLPPAVLIREATRRPEMRAIGLRGARVSHALAGLVAGVFLGAHLLMTAGLTFGYHVQAGGLRAYLGAVAYDVGANLLSAEWVFRGALFSLLWRRSAFWPAAALTTALALVRYLLDPALPHSADARAGAVFYLGLLGLTACALRAWSGSLLPGYLAALGFFAAYRILAP